MILSTLVLFEFWTGATGAEAPEPEPEPEVVVAQGGHFAPVGRRKKPREEYDEVRRELMAVMEPPAAEPVAAEVVTAVQSAPFVLKQDPARLMQAQALAERLVELARGLNRAAKREAQALMERLMRQEAEARALEAAHAAAVAERDAAVAKARRNRKIIAAVAYMWGD